MLEGTLDAKRLEQCHGRARGMVEGESATDDSFIKWLARRIEG